MVPAPRDPAKTKAARAALEAMKARMKKDFEDQWAALTPAEQAAVKKKWKVCGLARRGEPLRPSRPPRRVGCC